MCYVHRLEPLFYKYGVDIILEAHEHSYERLWPVYNEVVTAKNYTNPAAPVHLVSGTAGCSEGVDPMLGPRGEGISLWCTVFGILCFTMNFINICRSMVCISFLVAHTTWVWASACDECYPCPLGASDSRRYEGGG